MKHHIHNIAFNLLPLIFFSLSTSASFAQGTVNKDKLLDIAKKRGLSSDDLFAAASTFTPANKKDEFVCLNSGGQAGSVIAYGVPSMRILKYIPTTSPDSATGFHYEEQNKEIMRQGYIDGRKINWGDTHHPSFSETDGKYDGRYAFINDKANPRIFVMDLRDFETKQIVANPIFRSEHGGAFVTPNTEYVIEAAQYASTEDRTYRPMTQAGLNKHWRGGVTFHKFDNAKGKIDTGASFTIIAPPYTQDLTDAGKGESYGWVFINSLCSERYIGGIEKGRPPYEAGCSARDMDYMHVFNWKKAEELVAAGKAKKVRGHSVITLEQAASEGILFLIPEAKSPHGVDVAPDGRFIVVAGKLDTHAQVFDIRKIKDLVERKDYMDKDPYGVPILDHKKALHGTVELGLGPLHTQYDPKEGIAYTSVYIDSVVVKWDYLNLKVLDKVSVHYNIGHLVSMQGDSLAPSGKYLVSLNKLAIDRFPAVGPLHPQNHQLIDISGDKMRLLYDMPLPMGEPHYTVCIDANAIKPLDVYAPGTDPATMSVGKAATSAGKETVKRAGKKVDVFATVSENGLVPRSIDVNQGDDVSLHITSLAATPDTTFKVMVGGYNGLGVYPPGKTATIRFTASQAGVFPIRHDGVHQSFGSRRFAWLGVKPVPSAESTRLAAFKAGKVQQDKLHAVPKTLAQAKERSPGEEKFVSYGCSGCHMKGKDLSGPNLEGVVTRRGKDWVTNFIQAPEKYYEEAEVKALIQRFGIKMPNQGVTPDDARLIVEYLEAWK